MSQFKTRILTRPPASTIGAGVEPDGRIHPAIAPVDLLDPLIWLLNVGLVIVVLVGLPALAGVVAIWLLGSGASLGGVLKYVLLLPTVIWLMSLGFRTVKIATIDDEGLHFHKTSGGSEDWPWETIVAIRPATRWEVAWEGWLRPLLNPRERTSCMSTLGHYRIQGRSDYRFFPPNSAEAFLSAIAEHAPERLHLQARDTQQSQ